jgi:hypothetical protein
MGLTYLSSTAQPAVRSARVTLQFRAQKDLGVEEHIYCKFLPWDLGGEKHMLGDRQE